MVQVGVAPDLLVDWLAIFKDGDAAARAAIERWDSLADLFSARFNVCHCLKCLWKEGTKEMG